MGLHGTLEHLLISYFLYTHYEDNYDSHDQKLKVNARCLADTGLLLLSLARIR